jgi:RNA 2',3'-cyclic 3'-phosphodiesterase
MRLFVAIELPEPARMHLAKVQDALRPIVRGVAWARADNLHLPLKFLGEVSDGDVPALCEAIEPVRAEPMSLAAIELVCFPPRGPMRIIGAALTAPPALLSLVAQLESACGPLGFAPERRAYRPHITLARTRAPLPQALRGRLADATRDAWPGPVFAPEGFVLMHSQLSHQGSTYLPISRFI